MGTLMQTCSPSMGRFRGPLGASGHEAMEEEIVRRGGIMIGLKSFFGSKIKYVLKT